MQKRWTLPCLLAPWLAATVLNGQIVHPLAQPRYDQGPVEATFRLGHIQMMFQQTAAQRASLDQLLAAQRDPASPDYHKWLTPEQYADRFGLSAADLARATAWLTSAGFTIEYTARGRDWIAFSGTAAAGSSGVSHIRASVLRPRRNTFRRCNRTVDPTGVEAAGGNTVRLERFPSEADGEAREHVGVGVHRSRRGISRQSTISTRCTSRGSTESGQKIVIVGQAAGNSLLSDIQKFRSNYGLGPANIKLFPDGTAPGESTQGDQVEADLDLEWAGAIARNAKLIYVYGADADQRGVLRDRSESGSDCQRELRHLRSAGAVLGHPNMRLRRKKRTRWGSLGSLPAAIPGAAGCDYDATIGVERTGGEFSGERAGNHGGRRHGVQRREWKLLELGQRRQWRLGPGLHSGDGVERHGAWNVSKRLRRRPVAASAAFIRSRPGKSVRESRPTASGTCRISRWRRSNDHDPYNIISSGQTILVGGTSAATPVFAGMLALLNQHLKRERRRQHQRRRLYGLALSSPSMFHDIINNNNIVPCESGTPDCCNRKFRVQRGHRI